MRVGTFVVAVVLERRSIKHGSQRRTRRIDARTGADPSLRQTIVLLGVQQAIRWLARAPSFRSDTRRQRQALEFKRAVERIEVECAGDPRARREAITRLAQEWRPARGVWLTVLARTAIVTVVNRGSLPFMSEPRTFADLLAGTKLASRGPSRWSRLRAFGPARWAP